MTISTRWPFVFTKFMAGFVLIALLSLFVFTPHVNAATWAKDGSAVPLKGCAVTSIVLQGTLEPSISCLKRQTNAKTVTPYTGVVDCYASSYNEIIWGAEGTFCFSGSGYMAIHITHLRGIAAYSSGWVKMYPHGSTSGWFFNVQAQYTYNNNTSSYMNGNYDITQVCDACGFH